MTSRGISWAAREASVPTLVISSTTIWRSSADCSHKSHHSSTAIAALPAAANLCHKSKQHESWRGKRDQGVTQGTIGRKRGEQQSQTWRALVIVASEPGQHHTLVRDDHRKKKRTQAVPVDAYLRNQRRGKQRRLHLTDVHHVLRGYVKGERGERRSAKAPAFFCPSPHILPL